MTSQIKMATKSQFHMIYLDANSFCLRYDLLKMIFFTSITSINAEFKMACTLTIFVFKYNEIMQLFNWENHKDSVFFFNIYIDVSGLNYLRPGYKK